MAIFSRHARNGMVLSCSMREKYSIRWLCSAMRVTESGYSAWRKRPLSPRKREDGILTKEIACVFHQKKGRYGSPRIHQELRDQGRRHSIKRISMLMRQAGLSACPKRYKKRTVSFGFQTEIRENQLNQDVHATRPNQM